MLPLGGLSRGAVAVAAEAAAAPAAGVVGGPLGGPSALLVGTILSWFAAFYRHGGCGCVPFLCLFLQKAFQHEGFCWLEFAFCAVTELIIHVMQKED